MDSVPMCYYDSELAPLLHSWTEEMSPEHLGVDLLNRLMLTKKCQRGCESAQHMLYTETIRSTLFRDLMSKILDATTHHTSATNLLRFLIKEEGCLILRCLLKFGTKTLGNVDDLFHLLWYILKLKRSTEIEEFEMSDFNEVCGVCIQLVADLCISEAQSSRVKLPNESLAEFNVVTTNLLLEREGCAAGDTSSVNKLMLHTVQSYCIAASLVKNTRVIEESSVLVIVGEVALKYHSYSQLQEKEISTNPTDVTETSVVSACVIGLLQLLVSLLHKLHSLSHTMTLSADVFKLLDDIILPHTTALVQSQSSESLRSIVTSLFAVVQQMKSTKAKYSHNLRCQRKKHRRCDIVDNLHHHHKIMCISTTSGERCGAAYVTRQLLTIYQQLPPSPIKIQMVEMFSQASGCCCMHQSDFITPFTAQLPNECEANQHTLMSSLTHILLHQLSGSRTDKFSGCETCSLRSSQNIDVLSGIEAIRNLLTTTKSSATCVRIVLQHLHTVVLNGKSHLVFELYREIFKPLLDSFYTDRDAVSHDCVRLCLKSLTHAFIQDDCVDHFLSSAFGMKILEKCVAEYSSLLPVVLQIFSLLMQLRSEEQVLSPLLMLLLGEPEVEANSTGFVMIEFVYNTPDFNQPLSEKHMFLIREKWGCCHRLLHQSALFRSGFQSQNGIRLLLTMAKSILTALITNHNLASAQHVFLSDLFSTIIGCLLLCVHHGLSLAKQVFTIDNFCTEISSAFKLCDYTNGTELCIERSFNLLRLLLEASAHKLPTVCILRHDEDSLSSSTEEEGEMTLHKKRSSAQQVESNSSTSSSSEYEADDESYCDGTNPTLCFYTSCNLQQPELWMLTFDLMTWDMLTFTLAQQLALLTDLDKHIRQTDAWKFLEHKTEIVVQLLVHYRSTLLTDQLDLQSDSLTTTILSLVEYVCHLQITSKVLLQLLTLLKLSQFKEQLLRSFHAVITQSRHMPSCSISFPIERSVKEESVAVIVSQIARFGSKPVSAVLWLYLDGGISSAYNSSYKSKQPVRLISLARSQLTITLESEVANGNIFLVIGNGRGDIIGRLPVSSILTTNKWQMISFTADVKAKDGLQLYVQFSVGVDGRELVAGAETFTTPVKTSMDSQSDLDIHIGQGSNLFIKKHSIHFSHAMIFKGRLTDIQCAELYALGPRFDTFYRCIAEAERSTVNRRCVLGRRLPAAILDIVLKNIKDCQRQDTMQQILTIIGPKYKPYCLAYNQQPPTVIVSGRSPTAPRTRTSIEDFMCPTELEQPSAYYKNPVTVEHTVLEEALANLGGVHTLLYMYAKSVELKLPETSQILVLQCLLYTSQSQDSFSQAAQQSLDYRLLSKVLCSSHCIVTPAISKVLIDFALRFVDTHILLVDMTFIEQVLLDWSVWESRPHSWLQVLTALCDSVAPENKYRVANSQALLDSEILQTCIRIPLEQYHKESSYPMSPQLLNKLSLLLHRVLQLTQDKRLIWDISRYLLLLHPAAATFIQYERSHLYVSHQWSPMKRQYGAEGKGLLGRLRSHSLYTHDLFEDSVEDPNDVTDAEEVKESSISDGKVSELKGLSDYSTDTPVVISDSESHLEVPASTSVTSDCDVHHLLPPRSDSQQTLMPSQPAGNDEPRRPSVTFMSSHGDGNIESTVSRNMTIPSSPTFVGDAILRGRPDIITSHNDLSSSNESRDESDNTEHSLALLSSHLLHILLLICTELTPTDRHIFCSDLITLDTLTVFLNHDDVDVVYAALKLLSKVVELSSDEQIKGFIKRKGFHLVASQLNQIPSSHKLVTVCAQFINGQRCSMMKTEEMSSPFMLPLLGILGKGCHDLTLASKALLLTFQILEERTSCLSYAIHNGLIEVLCNCLSSINSHHPDADHEQLDIVFAYLHSILQQIAHYLVKHDTRVESIRSFVCMLIILERKERHSCSGFLAIERVETAIRVIFQELYSSIKMDAKSIPATFIQRMFTKSSNTTDTGLEEQGIMGHVGRRGSSTHLLSASMSSLHSLQLPTVESKNTRSSLTDMLLYTLQSFANYALYRVELCKRDENNLPGLTELLLDALVITEDSSKKSTWQFIVESDSVRKIIWKQLADVVTFTLSVSCDLFTAEHVISVMGRLTDSTQRKIVENIQLQANDLLLPNLKKFLQSHNIKAICDSFLTRLLDRLSLISSRSGTKEPQLPDNANTGLRERWLSHIKSQRATWKSHLTESKRVVFHSLDQLVGEMSHSATEINKDVVHRQNLERKKFIEHVKINMASEVTVRTDWQRLIRQSTHERAMWYNPSSFPQSWEIDPTEGPGRVRKRLQRCHMTSIQPKFLLEEYQYKVDIAQSSLPLEYLFEDGSQSGSASTALIYRLHTNETIRFTCKCTNVTPSTETVGDLLISDHFIHFVGDDAIADNDTEVLAGSHELLSIRWPLVEIKSFYKRRYQLQDNALEIFLTNGRTSLLAMDTTKERDVLWEELSNLHLPNKTTAADLESIQKQWVSGRMNNFDYLTHLNTLAGRSFNDLMQYPVFPFVLNQYEGSHLDLNDPQSYRKLNKPIACQQPENEQKFKEHYAAIEADIELCKNNPEFSHAPLAPYHYASHYSNSGVVLHYLVRLLPYTRMFLHYQDGQFDIPDRTFHSMHTSWLLSSERSSTDVKELIPEFYYLPEFMVNYEGFNFGARHTKEQVMDLNLPEWSKGDARLFVLILRQALENVVVCTNLQNWINLVFGYQQQGPAAKEAVNKFHPATYFGLEVNSIEDELQQSAIKVMIRTYGQMPKQLFTSRHPEQQTDVIGSSVGQRLVSDVPVLDTVSGLSWGDYVGTPADVADPKVVVNELIGAKTIAAISTGEIFGLSASSCILTHETKTGDELTSRTDCIWAARLHWGKSDNILRLQIHKGKQSVNFMSLPFRVTACASLSDCSLLLIASDTGFIQVHRLCYSKQQMCELSWVSLEVTLTAHHSAITSLVISPEYSIIISTDQSGLCVIWDLNKLTYIRCLESETKSGIACVTMSPTMGDIAFCSAHGAGSVVEVFTINAKPISRITVSSRVNWLCYSAAPEGTSVNVLVGALDNATLQMWSSWDLKPLRTLSVSELTESFTCCTYAQENQLLAASTESGRLIVWQKGGSPIGAQTKVKYFST